MGYLAGQGISCSMSRRGDCWDNSPVESFASLKKERVLLYAVFWTFALCFACWFNWNHWVDLSHHWTQRDLFWRYWRQHRPGEPIAAFQMDWKGETFYSRFAPVKQAA